jgi:transcriptional regulator with XRE-family HTH domain
MQLNTALGDAIRTARLEKGMTLRDLSAKSYISLGYLSEIERGTKDVSSVVLECVAQGLEVPLYVLVSKASVQMMLSADFNEIETKVVSENPALMEKSLTW